MIQGNAFIFVKEKQALDTLCAYHINIDHT